MPTPPVLDLHGAEAAPRTQGRRGAFSLLEVMVTVLILSMALVITADCLSKGAQASQALDVGADLQERADRFTSMIALKVRGTSSTSNNSTSVSVPLPASVNIPIGQLQFTPSTGFSSSGSSAYASGWTPGQAPGQLSVQRPARHADDQRPQLGPGLEQLLLDHRGALHRRRDHVGTPALDKLGFPPSILSLGASQMGFFVFRTPDSAGNPTLLVIGLCLQNTLPDGEVLHALERAGNPPQPVNEPTRSAMNTAFTSSSTRRGAALLAALMLLIVAFSLTINMIDLGSANVRSQALRESDVRSYADAMSAANYSMDYLVTNATATAMPANPTSITLVDLASLTCNGASHTASPFSDDTTHKVGFTWDKVPTINSSKLAWARVTPMTAGQPYYLIKVDSEGYTTNSKTIALGSDVDQSMLRGVDSVVKVTVPSSLSTQTGIAMAVNANATYSYKASVDWWSSGWNGTSKGSAFSSKRDQVQHRAGAGLRRHPHPRSETAAQSTLNPEFAKSSVSVPTFHLRLALGELGQHHQRRDRAAVRGCRLERQPHWQRSP